jgi:hypothetical protein
MFLTESLHGAPTYMGLWWAFWIISNVANNIASKVYDPQTSEEVFISGVVLIISSILTVAAAVLAGMVVRDITARQAARHLAVNSLAERESTEAAFSYQQRTNDKWRSNG